MSRALAARHGRKYVAIAALAIDVERVFEIADDTDPDWPSGWEVAVVAGGLRAELDLTVVADRELLGDLVTDVFEHLEEHDDEPLGANILFAAYAVLAEANDPALLRDAFHRWKKRPTALLKELRRIEGEPGALARLAGQCLDAPLEPALSEPTREALTRLSSRAPG